MQNHTVLVLDEGSCPFLVGAKPYACCISGLVPFR